MFNPIGPQTATVYWRRRLAVLGAVVLLIVLLVLTFNAMRSDGAGKPASKSSASKTSSRAPAVVPAPTTATTSTTSPRTPAASAAETPAKSGSAKSSAQSSPKPVAACVGKQLELRAMVGKVDYKVGDTPVLQLQVTNTSAAPCTQNLADQEVELRVYNGESRVWGSHDCKVIPGSNVRTLASKVPVLVSIQWSGLSSQPKCAGTRQHVNAGTYTLYAALAGRTGTATQFTLN